MSFHHLTTGLDHCGSKSSSPSSAGVCGIGIQSSGSGIGGTFASSWLSKTFPGLRLSVLLAPSFLGRPLPTLNLSSFLPFQLTTSAYARQGCTLDYNLPYFRLNL